MGKLNFYLAIIFVCASLFAEEKIPANFYLHYAPENLSATKGAVPVFRANGDEIVCPAEFNRADGVFLSFDEFTSFSPDTIWKVCGEIIKEAAADCNVYLLIKNSDKKQIVSEYLVADEVNMDNVVFIEDSMVSGSSIWVRDYGPFYIYEDGKRAINDFVYNTYPDDENISQNIGKEFDLPLYTSDLLLHGGNFITDGNNICFCSDNITKQNGGLTEEQISEELKQTLNIDSLVVVQGIKKGGSGHIDMYCKLLNDTLFIVGEYEDPQDGWDDNHKILDDIAELLGSMKNLDGRSFNVVRIPMPPFIEKTVIINQIPIPLPVTYTYTNSLILNNKVLVPVYGYESDKKALDIYTDLMPGYEIVGVNSDSIIQYLGAVHCLTKLHHSKNPLIVFHKNLTTVNQDEEPIINFRLNPKFANVTAEVYHKKVSETEFKTVNAEYLDGIWTAKLPACDEDIHYYISACAKSGSEEFPVMLPQTGADNPFEATVSNNFIIHNSTHPDFISFNNYPNPFSAKTIISFQIKTSGKTFITIYDPTGKIISKCNVTGLNTLELDASDMKSGVYFCHLQHNQLAFVKPLMVSK